jgi:hypothetical protein
MSRIRWIFGSKSPSPLSPWPLWSHFNQIGKTKEKTANQHWWNLLGWSLQYDCIDWRHHIHGRLLAEAAVAIAMVTPFRDDCDFVARNDSLHFGLLRCQFDIEIEHNYSFDKNNRCLEVHSTFSNLRFHFLQVFGYIQHGPLDVPSTFVLSKC